MTPTRCFSVNSQVSFNMAGAILDAMRDVISPPNVDYEEVKQSLFKYARSKEPVFRSNLNGLDVGTTRIKDLVNEVDERGNTAFHYAAKAGNLEIFELGSGAMVETISAHGGQPVWGLALGRDKRGLVSGGGDKTVKWWDWQLTETGQLSATHTRQVTFQSYYLQYINNLDFSQACSTFIAFLL